MLFLCCVCFFFEFVCVRVFCWLKEGRVSGPVTKMDGNGVGHPEEAPDIFKFATILGGKWSALLPLCAGKLCRLFVSNVKCRRCPQHEIGVAMTEAAVLRGS